MVSVVIPTVVMADVPLILELFGLGLILMYVAWRWSDRRLKPPCPPGLPIVGNWHQIDFFRMHIKLHEWWKQYGGIIGLHIFTDYIVVLQDIEVIREASYKPEIADILNGKRENFVAKYVLPNDMIFQQYDEKTIALKKALTKGMKLYGTGLKDVEALVQKEVEKVANTFQSRNGTPFAPYADIHEFLCRVITILVTGKELTENHEFLRLINEFDGNLSYLSNPGINAIMVLFPWLRHLPIGSGKVFQNISRNIRDLKELILKEEETGGLSGVSGLLSHLRFVQTTDSLINDANVEELLLDVLAAGVQTTKMYIMAVVLMLIHHPEIQRKIQSEIDKVIGVGATSISYRSDMPYTEAALLETFRFHTPLPLNIPNRAVRDFTIKGYCIPKGAQVIRNLWTVHHDETFWDEPHLIKPQRFLDENGELLPLEHPNRKRVLGFGIGRRSCPGEAFSKNRVFLFVTGLLQRFSFLPGSTVQDLPPFTRDNFTPGIVHGVKHFTTRVVPREEAAL